jgi:N-acetylmuramoyl-L-alanine amidase
VISRPSPNYDERTLPISLLVLHYTGMESGQAALNRMTDPAAKVSAHYMIEQDGQVFELVGEDHRAWHAGVAEWAGVTNVNSASIGIELVNGGHNVPNPDGTLPNFPDAQINALIPLCKAIMARHEILAKHVVGHSDIAPERKDDPGEAFPWAGLAAAGIGLWPGEGNGDRRMLFRKGDRDRGVSVAQHGLAQIGYGVGVTGELDEKTEAVLRAFQRRFRPHQVDGVLDMETLDLIGRVTQLV